MILFAWSFLFAARVVGVATLGECLTWVCCEFRAGNSSNPVLVCSCLECFLLCEARDLHTGV
ncbi:hypothetical protein KC19_5G196600 [Ceratodon purpureus]|uniref:Secreted protein n=1 Tax=Ceratodon purpureus TaxID=3225 RepID=A0A8T0I4T2_CERPU|nr:hypothetical protein KC19_5G196600 [Ceratodon purpureus]